MTEPTWIPVEESLPPVGAPLLFVAFQGAYEELLHGHYAGRGTWKVDQSSAVYYQTAGDVVSHWMPVPPLPGALPENTAALSDDSAGHKSVTKILLEFTDELVRHKREKEKILAQWQQQPDPESSF